MISVTLSFISSASSFGDDLPIRILTIQTPPYGIIDENDRATGLFHELNKMIVREAAVDAQVVMKPLLRIAKDLATNNAECTIVAGVPYVKENFRLIAELRQDFAMGVIPRRGIKIETYDDLKGISIGLPAGILISDRFNKDQTLNKVTIRNYLDGINLVSNIRLDAIGGVIVSLDYVIRNLNGDESERFGKPFIIADYSLYFVCRKNYHDEVKLGKIEKAIGRLKETGEMDTFVDGFFNGKTP